MKLPVTDPQFVETSDARVQEVFHSFSRGICPTCRTLVDGARILRDGKLDTIDIVPTERLPER